MALPPHSILALLALLAAPLLAEGADVASSTDAERAFATQVWPILEAKCHACHGANDEREAGLDLTTRNGWARGGESGRPLVVPGAPKESALYVAVTWKGRATHAAEGERSAYGGAG